MQCDQQQCQMTLARFLSCEPVHLSSPDGDPLIALAFETDDGDSQEFVTGLQDARDLVVELLASLACHGDEDARMIMEHHFLTE